MHIGVDIDDTITETTKLANAILHQDYQDLNIADYHELDSKKFKKFCENHINDIQKYMIIKDGVKEILDYWHNQGYKISIITARGAKNMDFLIPLTEEFLKNNNIVYDEIVFKQERKGETCQKLGINIFIDDKENVLDEIKKKNKNIKTIRFLNKKEESKHQTIRSWFELLTIIK